MRTASRLMCVLTLLTVGALVMPGPAVADAGSVPQAEYEAAYAAASAAAGVFVPGTTVNFRTDGRTDGDLDLTVNADGSMVGKRIGSGSTSLVRCVRVDRCWEQDSAAFGDLKWHRLPAGSVTYRLGRDYWSSWMGFPWPSDARFFVDTLSDGTPVYAVAYGTSGIAVMNAVTFSTGVAENVVMLLDDTGAIPTRAATYTATTERTAVAAPTRRSIGAPATQRDLWEVPINN